MASAAAQQSTDTMPKSSDLSAVGNVRAAGGSHGAAVRGSRELFDSDDDCLHNGMLPDSDDDSLYNAMAADMDREGNVDEDGVESSTDADLEDFQNNICVTHTCDGKSACTTYDGVAMLCQDPGRV